MRLLFTFIGGRGHFDPLVPVARAAERAGHTVAVAGSGKQQDVITGSGFTAFATSGPTPSATAPFPPQPADSHLTPDEHHFQEAFGRRGARRHAAALHDVATTWRPDVIVRDEVDFGAAIAAERLGIPQVTVHVLAAGRLVREEVVAEPLRELRAQHDLPDDPSLAMLDGDLVLSPFPPSFRTLTAGGIAFRPRPATARGVERDRPTVYFTLGTVASDSTDLFTRVLAGLSALDADVVATVGDRVDPAILGQQPPNVRVERFVPQDQILPACELVVSHGGSGSLMGALAYGLPSILLPLGADQPDNARRCAELGVGEALDAEAVTSEDVRAAAETVLGESRYRRAAERVQDEINALPGVELVVPALERLAR